MSIFFYGCISIDGYLSGKSHDLSWLYESGSVEEANYEEFYKTIDITVMGRNTFDEIIKMNSFSEAYPTTTNYVFTTHDDFDVKGAIAVSGNVKEFINKIDKDKNVWIVGGGRMLTSLLDEGLIDRMYLQIAPVMIGNGIPLFFNSDVKKRFKLIEVNKYGQFAELIYDKIV